MFAVDLREPSPTERQYLGTPPKAQRWGASDVDKPSVQLSCSMRGIDGGACSLAVITRTEYLTKGAAVAIILFFPFFFKYLTCNCSWGIVFSLL